jgi:hypothetical protein
VETGGSSSSEQLEEMNESAVEQQQENSRRSWIMLRKAEEALSSCVEDDYTQLQSELGPYRDQLTSAERHEFDRK